MTDRSAAFQEAMKLLGEEPLPKDAEARLEALEKKILPEERELFGDIWEGYHVSADLELPA